MAHPRFHIENSKVYFFYAFIKLKNKIHYDAI